MNSKFEKDNYCFELMAFYVRKIVESKLGRNEFLIVNAIAEIMDKGLDSKFTQNELAHEIGLNQAQVSRSLRKLQQANVVVRKTNGLKLNMNIRPSA